MSGKSDEHERTLAFAEIAVGQMKALRQPAYPRNYEVWYAYATGYNPSLNQSINETLMRNGGTLSAADIDQIYDTYLSPARLTDRLDNVGSQIVEEIDQVMGMIDAARGSTSRYGESLAHATEDLGNTQDLDGMRNIVESLVRATRSMEEHNSQLEQSLKASKHEISQLQTNLEAVRNESLTDPLTSLANRKYFDTALDKFIAHSVASGEPLALLLADIDHFKAFNDTYGHLTGDQVLRLVAMALKQTVKGQDIAARYGGEEFAIILPNTTLRSARDGRRSHSPRRHDQGTDEALDRRASRPHYGFGRCRDATQGGHRFIADRAGRQRPLCGQALRPQSRHVRDRPRGRFRFVREGRLTASHAFFGFSFRAAARIAAACAPRAHCASSSGSS